MSVINPNARISAEFRASAVKRLITMAMRPTLSKIVAERNAIVQDVYDRYVKPYEALIAALPDWAVTKKTELKIVTSNGRRETICAHTFVDKLDQNDILGFSAEEFCRHIKKHQGVANGYIDNPSWSCSYVAHDEHTPRYLIPGVQYWNDHNIPVDNDILERWENTTDEFNEFSGKIYDMYLGLEQAFKQVKTYGKLLEQWPELEDLVPVNEHTTQSSKALVVPIHNVKHLFNTLAGVQPVEKDDAAFTSVATAINTEVATAH